MRFALIIDDYLPHSTRVGAKMFHELAVELISKGHKVTVITPDALQDNRLEVSVLDGIDIWHFSTAEIKDVGKVKRAMNETLLSYRAWKAISSKVDSNTFDGIIYYSPSIFFGSLVKKLKQRCHCPAYLVLRDLFPQWVIDAGMVRKGSLIERYFRYFESLSYSQASMIGLMSERNQDVFHSMTKENYPTQILRNWAALEPHSRQTEEDIRVRLGLEDKVIYFYGGNIGHAQDMANLMRLAKAMQLYEQAHFLFVGQGDEVELINELAHKWELTNFSYLPSVDQEQFKSILAETDVGLFSLAANHTAHNFPGKLLGYMVQSMPILGSVNVGNDLSELVNENNAGLISVNGQDEELFANAIKMLDSDYRQKSGHDAYQLLCREFSVETIAENIVTTLSSHLLCS